MRTIVPRSDYIKVLDSYRKNEDLIKVITGIRRCGKSELIRQFADNLKDDGVQESDIIFIDLEARRYQIDSEIALYNTLKGLIRKKGAYVILDEVQLVKGWERVVSTVRNELSANVYITGSNSKMLSEELGTHLTGRYVTIHVMPFSFREFLVRYPIDLDNGYPQRFQQYLHWGGMPIIDLDDDDTKNISILQGVYESIINNDILPRVDINIAMLRKLTTFMMSNTGNLTSASKMTKSAYIGDTRTTERYLFELEMSHIFYKADNYDIVGSKHLRTNAKFYPADTGLMNAILFGQNLNESGLLECVVFLELIRRGYRVSVGSFNRKEVDFTAWREDGTVEFYQVALRFDDLKTLEREVDSFKRMGSEHRRVLLTMDREEYEVPDGVELINVVDWLLTVP